MCVDVGKAHINPGQALKNEPLDSISKERTCSIDFVTPTRVEYGEDATAASARIIMTVAVSR